jgi:hypothetical protein
MFVVAWNDKNELASTEKASDYSDESSDPIPEKRIVK